MRIGLVLHGRSFGSAIASVIDIVEVAEYLRADVDPVISPIELRLLAERRSVLAGRATLRSDGSLREIGDHDVVVVPAFGTLTGDDTVAALDGPGRAVVRALADVDPENTRLAAACTGVFALAESGHVAGRRATTSWFLAPEFRQRYPDVDLDLDSMVVADGSITTAGAAFAHIDLGLSIIRSISPRLAERVGQMLLIDERPSQAAFVAYDHLRQTDPIMIDFERYVRAHLDEPLDIAVVAASIGTSRRTLERRVRSALNLSPLGFVQRLRLERARHLLATTDLGSDDIALRVGYANAETLRALLRRG